MVPGVLVLSVVLPLTTSKCAMIVVQSGPITQVVPLYNWRPLSFSEQSFACLWMFPLPFVLHPEPLGCNPLLGSLPAVSSHPDCCDDSYSLDSLQFLPSGVAPQVAIRRPSHFSMYGRPPVLSVHQSCAAPSRDIKFLPITTQIVRDDGVVSAFNLRSRQTSGQGQRSAFSFVRFATSGWFRRRTRRVPGGRRVHRHTKTRRRTPFRRYFSATSV